MTFRKQGSGDARRTTPRQSDLLAQRNLRKAREELLLRVAFQFCRNRGGKSKLDQIHQIEVANQTECSETRTAGMKAERFLDAITLEQRLALADLFEDFAGEIFSFQEQAELRFVERRIVEQREENIRGRMMQERGEFIAGGHARAFAAFSNRFGHELTFGDLQGMRQDAASKLGHVFGNCPWQRAYTGVGSSFTNHAIEFGVEEYAAIEDPARFREKETRVLQIELPKNFLNLFQQVLGCGGQKSPRGSVARFSRLRHDGEYSRKGDSRLVPHQIHKLIPSAGKSAANFFGQEKSFLVQEFLKAKGGGFSPDVVGASWVANNWPKTPRPGKLQGLRSPQNGRASACD